MRLCRPNQMVIWYRINLNGTNTCKYIVFILLKDSVWKYFALSTVVICLYHFFTKFSFLAPIQSSLSDVILFHPSEYFNKKRYCLKMRCVVKWPGKEESLQCIPQNHRYMFSKKNLPNMFHTN